MKKMRQIAKLGLAVPAIGVAVGFAGLLGGLGEGSATAAPLKAAEIPGYTPASWWSPGCVTWHTSDGSCVGGQESKDFGKGFSCAAQTAPPFGFANAGDKEWRDKCLNVKPAE